MKKEGIPSKKPALNLQGDKIQKLSQQGAACESRGGRQVQAWEGPRALGDDQQLP